MSQILTVDLVGKYGPKMTDGKWYGLKKPLKKEDFEKGTSYEVELDEWAPGRFNIKSSKPVSGSSPAPDKKAKSEVEKQQKEYKAVAVDREEGQREGNRRNVAAVITQGLVMAAGLNKEDAYEAYKYLHNRLVEDDKV